MMRWRIKKSKFCIYACCTRFSLFPFHDKKKHSSFPTTASVWVWECGFLWVWVVDFFPTGGVATGKELTMLYRWKCFQMWNGERSNICDTWKEQEKKSSWGNKVEWNPVLDSVDIGRISEPINSFQVKYSGFWLNDYLQGRKKFPLLLLTHVSMEIKLGKFRCYENPSNICFYQIHDRSNLHFYLIHDRSNLRFYQKLG